MDARVEILTIEQAESRGWNDLVARHPLGSVFHQTAYGRMIGATFHHMTPYYLLLLDEHGSCRGGLVLFLVSSWLTGNRLVSLPWASYGDPMVNSVGEFEALFTGVVELSKRVQASYVEIKSRDSAGLLSESQLMVAVQHHKAHMLDIQGGLDRVWERLHHSCIRKMIGRAERKGVKVRPATSEAEVCEFHKMWCIDRRTLGLPPHNLEYFRNIWKYLAPLGLVQFWVAEKDGQLLGGLCTFLSKETVFTIYIAASGAFRRYGGGPCLYWAVIRSALERGLKTVDLGKTSPGDDGLMEFKRRWGAREVETPVFYYPRAMGTSTFDPASLPYRTMRYFWRTVPPGLGQIAGRFFWRHTG
jgi:CelD/BcsL family acetyltransferase involved in cellulose biosynthesis